MRKELGRYLLPILTIKYKTDCHLKNIHLKLTKILQILIREYLNRSLSEADGKFLEKEACESFEIVEDK